MEYLENEQEMSIHSFSLDEIPIVSEAAKAKPVEEKKVVIDQKRDVPAASTIEGFGVPIKSSASIALTEAETEYVVKCTKHLLQNHLAFQVTLLVIFSFSSQTPLKMFSLKI